MAFEQTQKTRVESKQFSGNWAEFAAPSGSTGNATEPYVEPSQGLDLSPLAKGIDGVVNTFENANRQSGGRGGSGDGDTGEFINRAYDIVELNTDANGVLSAKGSEAIRNLRRQMGRAGYTDSKIQSVLTAVGQDYKSTRQGMLQEESRKHDIDQEKLFAKKAVELHPELTGATLKEQADVGRRYYQKMNTLGATLRVAADPSAPKTVHDEALKSSADILITTINPTVLQNLFQQGTELSSQDELDATNEITKSIMSSGLVTDVREARSLAMEVSASFIGRARQYRTDMEKLTKDEQDRYLDLMTNQVRMELQNSDPVLFTKLSLTNWDLTKWPTDKLDLLQNFDASKFGGGKTTRYWQGAFDSYTANVGVQQGDPTIADVSQRQILDEALKRGDVGSANESLQSLMNPNLAGVLNKPQMADQREEAVNAYKQKIAGAMVNELRPHVQPTTGFVPGQGRVIDVGFWDTSSKITPIMDKWKEGMRHIGMSDQEIVETGENALRALGVAIPDNTTNPESFYQESARNIQQWMLQHPIKSKIPFADKATPASVRVSGAMRDYTEGKITQEEALAQMAAAMNEVNQDLAAEERANEVEVEQEGVNLLDLEQQAMNSPEFKQAVEVIAKDESLDPQQKSEMAQNTLDRIVSFLQEAVGIKSAHAETIQQPQNPFAKIKNYKMDKVEYLNQQEQKDFKDFYDNKLDNLERLYVDANANNESMQSYYRVKWDNKKGSTTVDFGFGDTPIDVKNKGKEPDFKTIAEEARKSGNQQIIDKLGTEEKVRAMYAKNKKETRFGSVELKEALPRLKAIADDKINIIRNRLGDYKLDDVPQPLQKLLMRKAHMGVGMNSLITAVKKVSKLYNSGKATVEEFKTALESVKKERRTNKKEDESDRYEQSLIKELELSYKPRTRMV